MTQVSNKITQLAKRFGELRDQIKNLEAQIDPLQAEKAQLADALKEEMEREEVTKFSIDGVGTVFLQKMSSPKIIGDPEKVIEWLDESGHPAVAPRTVSKERLKEFIEQCMEEDLPLPPTDLVQSTPMTFVRMRK